MTAATVKASPNARRIYGMPEHLVPGAFVIQLDGTPLYVLPTGDVEAVLPGGWPRPGLAHATVRRMNAVGVRR